MNARAVIFDMDGLLIDSERVILECWRVTAAEQSLAVDDTLWLSMVGLHDVGCAELLDGLLGAERAERLTLECKRRYDLLVEEGLPLKAGARELLQDLFDLGVPLAVATSTRGERARIKLARSGIDGYFSHVVTSSDVAHAKPAPDLYLLAAERLGIPPRECVAMEDSEFGVRAAVRSRNAGDPGARPAARVRDDPDAGDGVPDLDRGANLVPEVAEFGIAGPEHKPVVLSRMPRDQAISSKGCRQERRRRIDCCRSGSTVQILSSISTSANSSSQSFGWDFPSAATNDSR